MAPTLPAPSANVDRYSQKSWTAKLSLLFNRKAEQKVQNVLNIPEITHLNLAAELSAEQLEWLHALVAKERENPKTSPKIDYKYTSGRLKGKLRVFEVNGHFITLSHSIEQFKNSKTGKEFELVLGHTYASSEDAHLPKRKRKKSQDFSEGGIGSFKYGKATLEYSKDQNGKDTFKQALAPAPAYGVKRMEFNSPDRRDAVVEEANATAALYKEVDFHIRANNKSKNTGFLLMPNFNGIHKPYFDRSLEELELLVEQQQLLVQRLNIIIAFLETLQRYQNAPGSDVKIVHGDIKLGNIVICFEDGCIVIRIIDNRPKPEGVLLDGNNKFAYTPAYAAPEVRKEGSSVVVSTTQDIYSAAFVILEILRGKYIAEDYYDDEYNLVHFPKIHLPSDKDRMQEKEGLDKILKQALHHDPNQRTKIEALLDHFRGMRNRYQEKLGADALSLPTAEEEKVAIEKHEYLSLEKWNAYTKQLLNKNEEEWKSEFKDYAETIGSVIQRVQNRQIKLLQNILPDQQHVTVDDFTETNLAKLTDNTKEQFEKFVEIKKQLEAQKEKIQQLITEKDTQQSSEVLQQNVEKILGKKLQYCTYGEMYQTVQNDTVASINTPEIKKVLGKESNIILMILNGVYKFLSNYLFDADRCTKEFGARNMMSGTTQVYVDVLEQIESPRPSR